MLDEWQANLSGTAVMNMFSVGTAVMDMFSIGTGALKLYHLFE
jgi:hypothetical protein